MLQEGLVQREDGRRAGAQAPGAGARVHLLPSPQTE
jgi:hypothetical protein